MIRVLAVLLLLAGSAMAETARVISGEHADFTRLVVELPDRADWTVGRTAMGYAFAITAGSQPAYDLGQVWKRIPRTRLQALRRDPDSGVLQLTLACPCHVFPFEYRPGMIVIDIKDGPPPAGSAFESPFMLADGRPSMPPLAAPATYAWLKTRGAPSERQVDPALPMLPDLGPVALDPLRAKLLEQISRGASVGVIDMQLPGKPPKVASSYEDDLLWARISIGEMPGLRVTDGKDPPEALLPDGGACLPDALLALPEWGGGLGPLDLLAKARSGLYGEFDRLDETAVIRAVKTHLYLGFGAEAAQYGRLLERQDPPAELALYLSMARLIEGHQDPGTPFAGMLPCDGTAALWAALAHTRLPPGRDVNSAAIVRSFQALPPHLRSLLGPELAEKLRESGNGDAARMIRDALSRTPEVEPAAIALLDASADLEADRPDQARAHALTAIAEDGRNPQALIALVESHFRKLEPLSPEVAEMLRAFLVEAGGPAAPSPLKRAVILALALSGQADDAFAVAKALEVETADLWHVAQGLASDDTFLRHAVQPIAKPVPDVGADVRLAVAARLVDLGFSDAALGWLGPVSPTDAAPQRRIAARAELARGDARRALALLEGLDSAEDQALRAPALIQLGALAPARLAYEAAGMTEAASRLLVWEGDWSRLDAEGLPVWSDAASVTAVASPPEGGPLARGAALLDDSAAARVAVEALLSSVAPPNP